MPVGVEVIRGMGSRDIDDGGSRRVQVFNALRSFSSCPLTYS